jgi:hypothetical protein
MAGRSVCRRTRKMQCEECLQFDIRLLPRSGVFDQRQSQQAVVTWPANFGRAGDAAIHVEVGAAQENPHLVFSYGFNSQTYWPVCPPDGQRDDATKVTYPVRLADTPQHLGGRRRWLVCPGVVNGKACGRRVSVLYLPQTANYFLCRHCYGLVYRSAQEKGTKLEKCRKEFDQMIAQRVASNT